MKYKVFISYSHVDKELITPVVNLVKKFKGKFVFQDYQNIKPGKLWWPQLEKALNDANIIIVFWCKHSKKSDEVKKEYEKAIKDKKEILPILLDRSKLDACLAKYQWIDFKNFVNHSKSTETSKSSGRESYHPPLIHTHSGGGMQSSSDYYCEREYREPVIRQVDNQALAQTILNHLQKRITSADI